jgi:predicted permease
VWSDVFHRLRALISGSTVERELDEELRFHIDRQAEQYVLQGIEPAEAHRRARLQFGGLEPIKEEYRDGLGVRLLTDLGRDLAYAVRTLRRSPVFACTAIISLALGVGVNTIVFSIVNALVLKPLPITDPERVVFVQRIGSFVSHSFPFYRDLRDRNVTFQDLAGYRIAMMEVDAVGSATHEWGYLATGNYFNLLGVRPALGRFFDATDDRSPGASPYVILSHGYWRTRFGGRASVIGSTVRINRLPYTVLGVAPPNFHGTEIFYRPSVWIPMSMQAQIEVGNPWLENRNTSNTWVVGRLKPGLSVREAEGNLNAISRQLEVEYPTHNEGAAISLTRPGLVGDMVGAPTRAFACCVLALAGLVLLTACVNLASTLSARGSDRHRELAIRLSIGAGPSRIVRQLLTESLLLGVVGGAAGAYCAALVTSGLSVWQLPIALPIQLDVNADARVFAFAFIVSLSAAVAFGLAPARHAANAALGASMRTVDGAHAGRWHTREVFVGVQVALCFMLVAASLIALRGLQSALALPLGMKTADVTMAGFDLGLGGYSRTEGENLRRIALDRISAHPGVEAAAYANSLPLNIDQSSTGVYPDEQVDVERSEVSRAITYQVSPNFFGTLGIRLLRGRDIGWRDMPNAPLVALVNEEFTRRVLRTADGIGRHFRKGPQGPLIEVVGVVETGKYQSLTEPETPAIFEPMSQSYNTTTVLLVRSSLPTQQVGVDISRVLKSIDQSLPLFGIRSVAQMLGFVLLPMRAVALALGVFGVLAVILATTGIYGVVSYAVARRGREIAIRVAIGASRRSILQLVFGRIALLIASGTIVGVALALAARALIWSIVYHSAGNDWMLLSAVGAIVALVGFFACWVPARRALRVNPAAALFVE